MNTPSHENKETRSKSAAENLSKTESSSDSAFQFVDNRLEAIAQRKLQEGINNNPQVKQLRAFQKMAHNSPRAKQVTQSRAMADNIAAQQQHPIQKKENKTGSAQLKFNPYAPKQPGELGNYSKQEPESVWNVAQQKKCKPKPVLQTKRVTIRDEMHSRTEIGQSSVYTLAKGSSHSSSVPAQLVKGLVPTTYVQVNDGGPVWYGQIVRVIDENTYEIRVGGSDRTMEVPQNQVNYHPTVAIMNRPLPDPARYVDPLPVININGELGTFAGEGGLQQNIVTAQGQMTSDQDTGAHTIAMFNYMARYAQSLGENINKDFGRSPKGDRDEYLQKFANNMSPKLGDRGVWSGPDRAGVVSGSLMAAEWFAEGKRRLLEKAGQAQANGRSLTNLLEIDSHNNDAKSYGRRTESWYDNALLLQHINPPPAVQGPPLNTPIPYNTEGYVFYDSGYSIVDLNQIEVGEAYNLIINNQAEFEVTVSAVEDGNLTFSKVD